MPDRHELRMGERIESEGQRRGKPRAKLIGSLRMREVAGGDGKQKGRGRVEQKREIEEKEKSPVETT